MTSPTSRTLAFAEDSAFAFARALAVEGIARGDLVAIAQRLVTEAIDEEPDNEELDASAWEAHNRRKLDSAAHIIASLAPGMPIASESRAELELLAALSFSLDGNSAAASVLGQRALRSAALTNNQIVAAGVGCPQLALDCVGLLPETHPGRRILTEQFGRSALGSAGSDSLALQLNGLALSEPQRSARYFFSIALQANAILQELRFDGILRKLDIQGCEQLLSNLRQQLRFFALPSQRAVLEAAAFAESATNLLVSLPTGAGKTLIGLVGLAREARSPADVVVFLAPYHAIRRAVETAAAVTLRDVVDVVENPYPVENKGRPSLLIETPERFDARLRRDPALAGRLRAVVLDEAHLLSSSARGVLADGILSRLRLGSAGGGAPRLFLLSAVVEDAGEIVTWLGEGGKALEMSSKWRPAARRIAVWESEGSLTWLRTVASPDGKRGIRRVAAASVEPAYPRLSPGSPIQTEGRRWNEADLNAALLATALNAQNRQQTLIVVGTRARSRSLARVLASRLPPSPQSAPEIDALRRLVEGKYPQFRDLLRLVDRRVAYHSALLPLDLRAALEDCIRAHLLEFVAATTTLAEGADLPFGRCILADWTHRSGLESHKPFDSGLFRNIAGRCGRPGAHIEGETVIIENTPPVAFASRKERVNALQGMLAGVVSIDSPFRDRLGGESAEFQQLLSQSLAAVSENPVTPDVHLALWRRMLASRRVTVSTQEEVDGMLEHALLAGEEPLAARASPLRLSPIGQAVHQCPTLPATSLAILRWLREGTTEADAATVCKRILEVCAKTPELEYSVLSRMLLGRRVPNLVIRPSVMTTVCEGWLSGDSVGELMLRCVQARGDISNQEVEVLGAWLAGEGESESWLRRYDKFVEVLRGSFAEFLPRAFATAITLRRELKLEDTWSFDSAETMRRLRAQASSFVEADSN